MSTEAHAVSSEVLLRIYRTVVQTRLFEARVIALHRHGKISIYASSEGEEAVAVACTSALVLFGDGATSSDGFHAGLNIAGVHRLPIVFMCRNNQYAISLPLAMQTASKTIAVKAEAYGFEGIQVDGSDPVAVYEATRRAL